MNTMLQTTSSDRAKPETMVTLACSSCRMALYLTERAVRMPTWRCPSCGMVTKTNP